MASRPLWWLAMLCVVPCVYIPLWIGQITYTAVLIILAVILPSVGNWALIELSLKWEPVSKHEGGDRICSLTGCWASAVLQYRVCLCWEQTSLSGAPVFIHKACDPRYAGVFSGLCISSCLSHFWPSVSCSITKTHKREGFSFLEGCSSCCPCQVLPGAWGRWCIYEDLHLILLNQPG